MKQEMKQMKFFNNNTVLFDNTEMHADVFFSVLNKNIDDEKYSVYYSKANKNFTVCYNGEKYDVIFDEEIQKDFDNDVSNPIIKKLISLSSIQEVVDVANNNGIIASEILDDDTKKIYLANLKSQKFSFKKYVGNFLSDFFEAKEYISNKLDDDIDFVCFIGGIISFVGVFFGIYFASTGSNLLYLLLGLSGFAVMGGKYLIQVLFYHTGLRISRLIDALSNRKLRKSKIKSLEKSLNKDLLSFEDIKSYSQDANKKDIKSIIPTMINKLIELLKSVDPSNRGSLTNEIREFILEYKKMICDNSKSDIELFLENKSICDRIVDLELRINEAKKLNSNRSYEVDYLLGKLDTLDENEQEHEQVQIQCKIM